MKFSTRDRYALRLMTELADHGGALVPLKEISTAQQISLKYLEQIITPLARAGLVASVRGALRRRSPQGISCGPWRAN